MGFEVMPAIGNYLPLVIHLDQNRSQNDDQYPFPPFLISFKKVSHTVEIDAISYRKVASKDQKLNFLS
ncbi:hypothetical protein JYB64_19225 [Algoriphagus aestuarii]|nr:hypothetical protein [Algoriphagus aestuarii]